MRRVITTLAILLVVMIAGLTALVVLINPNDFRSYMTRQVEQRSGYQLALKGELRWHVWPQLSILSGPVTLTAPGALQPLVSAENMRLDVNLLPLISHQLSVKQVLLKNAVVRLIPESQPQRPADAPVGPAGSVIPSAADDVTRGWRFDISHLQIVDSLLVWQQGNGEQLNVRDFNLQLDQTQPRLASLKMSSRITRDQRELRLKLNSDLDISSYPRQLTATVNQLDYQLQGADVPPEGITGQATLTAAWNTEKQFFSLSDLNVSVNGSQLGGTISGSLGERPQVTADLTSSMLNLDALMGIVSGTAEEASGQPQHSGPGPVMGDVPIHTNIDSPLNAVDGSLSMSVAKLRWRGMDLSDLVLKADNQQGLLRLNTFNGKMAAGQFSLPGTVSVRNPQTQVMLKPSLQNIAITPLLKAFDLPETLSGSLSLNGNFHGVGLTVDDFKRQWQGSADLTLKNALLVGLNFQQIVQRAVEGNSDKVRGEHDDSQPNLQQIAGQAELDFGRIDFSTLNAHSSVLDYSGSGSVDLTQKLLDFRFGVTVTQGWRGDDTLVKRLQETPLPLHIYGPWSTINYSLKVDSVFRQQLRDEARRRLKEWMQRNPEKQNDSDVKKLLKDL